MTRLHSSDARIQARHAGRGAPHPVAARVKPGGAYVTSMGTMGRWVTVAWKVPDPLVSQSAPQMVTLVGRPKADLEDLLGAEVDVVPRSCLRDRYRTMLADAIPL